MSSTLVVGFLNVKIAAMDANKKDYVIKRDNVIKLQKLYEKIIKQDNTKDNGKTNDK